jgi:hypothetical protein
MSPIIVTLDANAGLSTSAKQREGLLSDSPRPTARQESESIRHAMVHSTTRMHFGKVIGHVVKPID